MKRIDEIHYKAHANNPDWEEIAKMFADRSGSDGFPATVVEDILNHPNEVVVSGPFVTPDQESIRFSAIIPDEQRPFELVYRQDDFNSIASDGLQINPRTKDQMPASREVAVTSSNPYAWMGAGTPREHMTLTVGVEDTQFHVGTTAVRSFFERLEDNEQIGDRKRQVAGALFYVARLALDFDSKSPTSPLWIREAVQEVREEYIQRRDGARMLLQARAGLVKLSEIPLMHDVPMIYARPIDDFPVPARAKKALQLLGYQDERHINHSLKYLYEGIATMDALLAVE